jgi:hypothetical protein
MCVCRSHNLPDHSAPKVRLRLIRTFFRASINSNQRTKLCRPIKFDTQLPAGLPKPPRVSTMR